MNDSYIAMVCIAMVCVVMEHVRRDPTQTDSMDAFSESNRPRVGILSSVHRALDARIFYREARSLQRAGYDVTIIAVHECDEVREGIHIIALPRVARWQRPRLWLTLLHHALAIRADVFHFHDPELLLITPILRLATRKPTVYDIHEAYVDFIKLKTYLPAWSRNIAAWAFRWLERLLLSFQSALIFADDQIACAFVDAPLPHVTLYNYPERTLLQNALAEGQKKRSPPQILHLGSHERSRGAYLMIEAFFLVLQQVPDAHLLLVGPFTPASLEERIRHTIAQHGIEHAVTVVGQVPFQEVGKYLAQATVGWIPLLPVAKYEKNIPSKLFEYMAYGLPIISSDLESTRPFVADGENGFLVRADVPAAHAQAIVHLIRQPELATVMGNRGRELVHSLYKWDAIEERLLHLYQQLL